MATPIKKLTFDPQRNYITARAAGYARGQRQLPVVNEDVALNAPGHTYDQMMCDSEVSAAVLLLVHFVLADGVTVSTAVEEKDPNFEIATEIRDHIERTICGLKRPLKETLEQITRDALSHGNKLAEKTYKIPTEGPDAFMLVLDTIKPKCNRSTSFVVDPYMNLVGIVQSGGYVNAESQKVIDPEKFVIASFRMIDEDPRGTSLLRAAVKPWNVKQLGWPEFVTYMMRCAVPGLVGKISASAKDFVKTDSDGNAVLDSSGNPVVLDPIESMLNALIAFRNSTALAIENDADVTPLEVAGEGEAWERFNTIVNKEIRKAILLQELATADSQHQTKSSTSEQMDIVETLVWSIKTWLSDIIQRQIFKPQVSYNYGPQIAEEFTPVASLGDYDRKDWSSDSEAVVKLCTATVIDESGNTMPLLTPSQIQSLLTQIGLPSPTVEEIEAMRARQTPATANNQQNQGQA